MMRGSSEQVGSSLRGSAWLSAMMMLSCVILGLTVQRASAQAEEASFQGIDFVKITPSQFILGSPLNQLGRVENERERRVSIGQPFWIGKYEVTQAQWEAVMGSNPSTFRALGPDRDYPVESVSWHDAQRFITALNETAGGAYFRLPTEAEWEYVAKANNHGAWSFGDLEALLSDYTYRDGAYHPYRVGDKLPNPWGVYDLYGNVYEWCEDWYQKWSRPQRGACSPDQGTYKVIRGGSRGADTRYLRSSSRNFAHPDRRGYYLGFRLVRVMDPLTDLYRSGAPCVSPPFCGDGVVNGVNGAEACDDGNLDELDQCDSSCQLNAEADQGGNQGGAPGVCGDQKLNAGEACDDGGDHPIDFCDQACNLTSVETPLLVLIIDFSDSDTDLLLPDSEREWSDLIFGSEQGQGNHYWAEVFDQRFALEPVDESAGDPGDGVIRVKLNTPRPSGGARVVVEDQDWVPDALDAAANHMNFASYDQDGDGILRNHELSVLVVLNTPFSNISGAGAQANIRLDHQIANTGMTLPLFSRTLFSYSSIGVNMHELGHHIFSLDHFAPPGDHGLMSTGAYGEDPVVGRLDNPNDHWGTRPTHPISLSRLETGAVTPTVPEISADQPTQIALHSIHSGSYNVVILPTADSFLLLENRERVGYDQSIPFCDQDQGAVFITEIAQYVQPVDVANIVTKRESQSYIERFDLCDRYALAGHNDSFSFGGYDFSGVSAAGPTMTLQVQKSQVARELATFKWRWFKLDPDRLGYRLWWYEEALELAPTVMDFSEIPGGDDFNGYFTLRLEGHYNTGEIRSLNPTLNWSSSDPYVSLQVSPVTGGEATVLGDAIVRVVFDPTEACPADRRVTVTAELEGAEYRAELTEIPCP